MRILVTGGAGFIGTNFVHEWIRNMDGDQPPVVVLDKLTYASNLGYLLANPKYKSNIIFSEGDIGDHELVADLLWDYRIDVVINFAAESHVDRSIEHTTPFIQTNIVNTEILLHACNAYHESTYKMKFNPLKFLHVSTDEVYGSLSPTDPKSKETSLYAPRSVYAASKAASDHLVMAYHHTHGLPVIITNCSNNYGPYQHAEKFIPTVIRKAFHNEKIPVYGTGENIRDWLYVTDHCEALRQVAKHGLMGHKYNIGAGTQTTNIDLAHMILDIMGKPADLIEFVEDRKGHDWRYDVDSTKIRSYMNWYPKVRLREGLSKTVEWYTKELSK